MNEWMDGQIYQWTTEWGDEEELADGCLKNSELAVCEEALHPSGTGFDSHIHQQSHR